MGGYYADKKCIFPGGYKQVIDVLANDLTICLSSPVKHIKYNEDDADSDDSDDENSDSFVIVTTNDNKIYQAKQVIITVSIGVLKSNLIKFEPSLPKKKQRAIQRLD